MGVFDWIRDIWLMMLRTKPQYMNRSTRRSSIDSSLTPITTVESKLVSKLRSCVCLVAMCGSLSIGISFLLLGKATLLTTSNALMPLIIAGIAAITGGLCLSEYMSQPQEMSSIYSCCYRNTSEVFAFFIGWTWLCSSIAMVTTIARLSSEEINSLSGGTVGEILEETFSSYSSGVSSVIYVIIIGVVGMVGVAESILWYVSLIPLSLICAVSAVILEKVSSGSFSQSGSEIKTVDQALNISSLCILFFMGPQSIIRSAKPSRRKTKTPPIASLNIICLGIALVITLSVESLPTSIPTSAIIIYHILTLLCLSILSIETYCDLHCIVQEMSSDGLLFRSFSKRWKPLCVEVASPVVHLISVLTIGAASLFLSLSALLQLTVMFPLTVNSVMPFLVLIQRYRDNTSWQYEPMLQTTSKSIYSKTRSRSSESQYTNGLGFDHSENIKLSTSCLQEDSSSTSSDTDIDSVVKQYKDQAKIANMPVHEEHDPAKQLPEPTPSSSFHAKLCIIVLTLIAFANAIVLNMADTDERFPFIFIAMACFLGSIIIQGLLLCLPQNKSPSTDFCSKMPLLPWIPGICSYINILLLSHCLLLTWKIYIGWLLIGVFLYFTYGIRSSTAANSFHNLRTTHIALSPLPSYGNKCVSQVVPSQRKRKNYRQSLIT